MSVAVQSLFGRIAHRYDLVNRVLSARRDVAWRRRALDLLEVRDGVILDLACGTGDLGLEALARGQARRVHGADFCQPMLIAGASRMRGRAMSASVGDALALPYADGSFDAVTIAFGWRNVDDPAAAAREMARVLKPGGELLVLEFFRPQRWATRGFHAVFARVAPLFGAVLAGDGAAYRYLHASIQDFLSLDEAQDILATAGFSLAATRGFEFGVSHAVHARRG